MAPHEHARHQQAPTVAQPVPARRGEAARQPPLAALQRSAGNQAVAQLVGAGAVETGVDPLARVDQLRLAIRLEAFPRPILRIDLEKAAEALNGLTSEDGRAIKAEYRRRTGWTLGWVLSGQQDIEGATLGNTLARAERTRLLNLLDGTVATTADPAQTAATAELVSGVVSGVSSLLGVDAPVASAIGERAADALGARQAAEDERSAGQAAASRYRSEAAQVRRAIERQQGDAAIALIRRPDAERQALATAYDSLYGESLYNALTTRLSGRDRERAAAIWIGDAVTADRLALEADLQKQARIDFVADEAKELADSFPALGAEIARKRRAARSAVEARLSEIAAADQPDTSSGRAAGRDHLAKVLGGSTGSGASLDERLRATGDRVMAAIVDQGEPEELAARLARADREGTLTSRDLEAALRQLRILARRAAIREIMHQPEALLPQRDRVIGIVTDGYYQRFQRRFDADDTKRTLDKALGVGSGPEAERNRSLYSAHGELPAWRELDLALRRRPRDMDRVRIVLGDLTAGEIGELTTVYATETGRSLRADLMGSEQEQAMERFRDSDAADEALAEKQVLLQGGRFEAKASDEVGQLEEERRWLDGRFFALERAVLANRGLFAEARDWLGNLEKDLVDRAHADAADASAAMARALTDSPPDVTEARRRLLELRRATARIERNLVVYKEATRAAFDEFVDLAVLAVTTVITAGQGSAIVMAIRTTIATVGTKALLKGADYSLDEFLMDLRSGLGSAVGGKLTEGLLSEQMLTTIAGRVAGVAQRTGLSKEFAGKVLPKLGAAAKWEAENVLGSVTTNAFTNQSLTSGLGFEGHANALIQHGATTGIRGMRGDQPGRARSDGSERTGTAEPTEGPGTSRVTDEPGSVARPASEAATRGPMASAPDVEGGLAGGEGTRSTADVDVATVPEVSMRLPEVAEGRGSRTPRGRIAHADEGPGPVEPGPDVTPGPTPDIGDATQVDARTRAQQEQARRAGEHPDDLRTVRETTAPDARARALADEFAPLIDRWHELEAPERLEALERIVNPRLAEAGLPRVWVEFPRQARDLGGARGGFAEADFKIYLDERMVREARTPDDLAAIADFVSHEARHALHTFRGMRAAMAAGRFDPTGYDARAVAAARDANSGHRPAEDMAAGRRVVGPTEMGALDPAFGEAWQIHQEMNSRSGRRRERRHDREVERIRRRMARFEREVVAAPEGSPDRARAEARLREARSQARRLHQEYMAWAHESDAWRMGSAVRAAMTEAFIRRRMATVEADLRTAQADGERAMGNQREREQMGADTTHVRRVADEAIARERTAEAELDMLRRQLEALEVIRRGETAPETEAWPDPEDFDAPEG